MLRSMTGFGDAVRQDQRLTVSVEARSVNNRFLRVQVKLPDSHGCLADRVERLARSEVRRGSVNLQCRVTLQAGERRHRISAAALQRYIADLEDAGLFEQSLVPALLRLPGVVEEHLERHDPEDAWSLVEDAVRAALADLDAMRRREGEATVSELRTCLARVTELVGAITVRVPTGTEEYRQRLRERLETVLSTHDIELDPASLVREVAIYAERVDVNEELGRLRSHVEQFQAMLDSEESEGRKLDFLTQELHREANTIGSKSGDAELSRLVVDLKAEIERVREIVQNIE